MFSKFKIVFLFALLFLFSAQASAAFFDFRAPELFKKIPNSKSLDLSNRVRVKVPGVLTIEPYWYGAHQNIQASIPMDSIFVKLTAQVEAFKITTLTYRKVGTEPVSDFGDVVLYEYERPRGLNREIARGTFNSDGMIRFKNENGLIFVRSGEEKFVFIKAETKATAAGGEVSLALAINEEDSVSDFEAIGLDSGRTVREAARSNNNALNLTPGFHFIPTIAFVDPSLASYLQDPDKAMILNITDTIFPLGNLSFELGEIPISRATQSLQNVLHFKATAQNHPLSLNYFYAKCEGPMAARLGNGATKLLEKKRIGGQDVWEEIPTADNFHSPCSGGYVFYFLQNIVRIDAGETKEFLLQYDTYVIPGMVLDEPENWVNFSVINISFSLANADAARPISCVRTPELCLGLPLDGPRMYF